MKYNFAMIFILLFSCNGNPRLKEPKCNNDGVLKKGEVCYGGVTSFILANGVPFSPFVFADWNQDGSVDAAVISDNNPTFILELLLGDAQGTFSEQSSLAFASPPPKIQAAQLNEDALPDLMFPEGSTLNVFVSVDNGFLFRTSLNLVVTPQGLLGADLDSDGDDEIIFSSPGQVSVIRNTGNALFEPPISLLTQGNADRVFAKDLNGDGSLEVIVMNKNGALQSTLDIFPNLAGILGVATNISLSESSIDIAFGDLDGDGLPEIISIGRGGVIEVLQNDGKGIFGAEQSFSLPLSRKEFVSFAGVVVGDFDNDDALDIAVLEKDTGDIYLVLNGGRARFPTFVRLPSAIRNASEASLASFDFNLDSLPDLAVSTSQGLSLLLAAP
jgi:hypothetical protein